MIRYKDILPRASARILEVKLLGYCHAHEDILLENITIKQDKVLDDQPRNSQPASCCMALPLPRMFRRRCEKETQGHAI